MVEFRCGRSYMKELKERGINEQPRLVMKKRAREKVSEAMTRYIFQLYIYVSSKTDIFFKRDHKYRINATFKI